MIRDIRCGRRTCMASAAALLLFGLSAGCSEAPSVPPGDLNVLLITLDTTRPDQLGCYGGEGDHTPNLDALAKRGTLFQEVVAPAPLTLVSHASILTGLYPFHHGVRMNGFYRLDEEQTSLAEILRDNGFATAAFVSGYVLDHTFQLDQGFDYYDDDLGRGSPEETAGAVERKAGDVTKSALRWLKRHGDERFFLWVHYFDPHLPYEPPPEYAVYWKSDLERYQGEIAYVDHCLGELIETLRQNGLYERTVIIAAGDHGEAFGENGEYGHGLCMYNSTLLCPLIMRLPRIEGISSREGRRVKERVSLVDIAPTLMEVLGLEAGVPWDGRSLVNSLEGEDGDADRTIYAETAQGKLTRGWCQLSGVFHGDWKYILAPAAELYDLSHDAGERDNRAGERPSLAQDMERRLVDLASASASPAGSSMPHLDADAVSRLQTLGYITGSTPPEADVAEVENELVTACRTGRDIKDLIVFSTLVDRGVRRLGERRPDLALDVFQQAASIEGDDPWLLSYMGDAHRQLQMLDEAVADYRRAVGLDPDDAAAWNGLAMVYHARGDYDLAVEALQQSIEALPTFYQNHLNLAVQYDQLDRHALAEAEFQAALELAPEMGDKKAEVLFEFAASLFQQGKLKRAKALLERGLRISPNNRQARDLLRRIGSP